MGGTVTYVYVCATVKDCPSGYEQLDVVDEHGCINRTCTPPSHCVYNGDVHMPGVTWDEDVCLECTCSATPNADGEYTSECTSIQCGKSAVDTPTYQYQENAVEIAYQSPATTTESNTQSDRLGHHRATTVLPAAVL